MNGAAESRRKTLQVKKVERAVFVCEEAGCPIVTALDDVHGHIRQHQSGAAGHYWTTLTAFGALTAPKRNVVCP